MSHAATKPGLIRNLLRTAGPPLAIGACVLALSVAAAGGLAWFVMGDEIAETATALLGHAEPVAPGNTVSPTGLPGPADS